MSQSFSLTMLLDASSREEACAGSLVEPKHGTAVAGKVQVEDS